MNRLPKTETEHLNQEEIQEIYESLVRDHASYLEPYDVKLPSRDSTKALWLVFLRKHRGELVHKDTISTFVESVMPWIGRDQQVRHVASDGWFVLNAGEKIPDENRMVPPGYHVLVTTEGPKPNFLYKAFKRAGRVSARNFEQLKIAYRERCPTCGSQENKPHLLDPSQRTKLEQAHMDPSKPLTLNNTIPQCQLCNGSYKDNFVFDDRGRVIAVASAQPVVQAHPEVRKIIWTTLNREFKK